MKLPDFLVDHSDGEIRLTGHRIGLIHIIESYRDGSSPEEIVLEYPTLSLPLVYNVVAFYLNNRRECDKYAKEYEAECRRNLKKDGDIMKSITVAEVRKRMEHFRESKSRRTA